MIRFGVTDWAQGIEEMNSCLYPKLSFQISNIIAKAEKFVAESVGAIIYAGFRYMQHFGDVCAVVSASIFSILAYIECYVYHFASINAFFTNMTLFRWRFTQVLTYKLSFCNSPIAIKPFDCLCFHIGHSHIS